MGRRPSSGLFWPTVLIMGGAILMFISSIGLGER